MAGSTVTAMAEVSVTNASFTSTAADVTVSADNGSVTATDVNAATTADVGAAIDIVDAAA